MSVSDEDDEECAAIVIDNGSSEIRSGFCGDEAPRSTFETVLGTKADDPKTSYIGDALTAEIKAKSEMTVSRPIEHGLVTRWEDMEKIWHHTFDHELRVDPKEHPVLMTRQMNTRVHSRWPQSERTCQIMFERFEVPGFQIMTNASLSLYASGRTTGLVIDCGYQITQLTPIYEGHLLPHASRILNVGGHHVTENLQDLGYENGKITEYDDCQTIKETRGFIAAMGVVQEFEKAAFRHDQLIPIYLRSITRNYSAFTPIDVERRCNEYCGGHYKFIRGIFKYELPDGNIIELQGELFQCTEVLFHFSRNSRFVEKIGIPHALAESINKCDVDIRKDLWGNVVIAGRGSLFENFAERLESELKDKDLVNDKKAKLKIIASRERGYMGWIGGSIVGSLSTFQEQWISADEYAESGASMVRRKCHE